MAGPPLLPQRNANHEGVGGEAKSQRWCVEEPCRRRPFFGLPGGKPMFCAQHSRSREGMVDVSSRRCEAVGCAKWPLYGNEGEKAKFCSLHKSTAMIDVRSRRCAAPDCKRQPSYGFEGKRACYCAAHKLEGQVDVVSRRCEEPNCRRRPLYGYEGKKSQFCSAHKQVGQVDVCNRRCQRHGCSKRPCFGLPGQRPSFCGSHRSPEMVDVISHKCAYPGCSHPTGHEASRVRSKFCDKHKSVGQAGASLLQLAGAAAESSASASTAGTGQSSASPPLPSNSKVERFFDKSNSSSSSSSRNNPGLGGLPMGSDGRQVASELTHAHTQAPMRCASFNMPMASADKLLFPDVHDVQKTPRRASISTPLLPSLQSLLEDVQSSGLKRHREEVRTGPGPYDVAMVSASSLPPPQRRSQEAGGLARLGLGGVGIGVGSGAKNDGGREAIDERSRCDSGVANAPAQSKPPGKSSRLFSESSTGSGQQGEERAIWQNLWSPNPVPVNPGYVMSSPDLDWRRVGLSSLGRAASFDEARAAASVHGLHAADSSKPRRASAFVPYGSALPPVVTEVGRRCSALETRPLPEIRRGLHYSEILSAQPSRSVTAFNGRTGYSPFVALGHPDTVIEEEANDPAGLATQGAGGGAGAGAPNGRPFQSTFPATRMYHLMPAAAVFHNGLTPRSMPAKTTASRAQGGEDGGRRWSVIDLASSGATATQGGEAFVPAWGAPDDEENDDEDAPEDKTSAVEGCGTDNHPADTAAAASVSGSGSGVGNVREYHSPNRQPRRGSMMRPEAPTGRLAPHSRPWTAPDPSGHDRAAAAAAAASVSVPAWGATNEAGPAEEPTPRPADSVVSARRAPRRVGALFGGDGVAGKSESGGTGVIPRAANLAGAEGKAARRGSMMAPLTPMGWLDHQGPRNSALVQPSWGAPPAPRRGSMIAPGPATSSSQRRGSFVAGIGAATPSSDKLSGDEEGVEIQRQQERQHSRPGCIVEKAPCS